MLHSLHSHNNSNIAVGRGVNAWPTGAKEPAFKLHTADNTAVGATAGDIKFADAQLGSNTCNAFMNRMATTHRSSHFVLPSSPAVTCQVNFAGSAQALKQESQVDDRMQLTLDDADCDDLDFDQPSHDILFTVTKTASKSILKVLNR